MGENDGRNCVRKQVYSVLLGDDSGFRNKHRLWLYAGFVILFVVLIGIKYIKSTRHAQQTKSAYGHLIH